MRVLRAVLNYAMGEYRDENGKPILIENPVHALSHDRSWNREDRRKGHVEVYQLADWWRATAVLDEVFRDYLQFVLLTGLRRREASRLRWTDIDLAGGKLTVLDTKNSIEHTLPLSDYLYEMLARRQRQTNSEWVFPSSTSRSGHLEEPKTATARIAQISGVRVTVHDLRRTFITIAESLEIPPYTLKRLLNHKSGNADVTSGYIVIDTERLRNPCRESPIFILKAAEMRDTAEVVPLKNKHAG
ncbi:MAG: tyrosine-type recombinase/integrase [Gammaproteobacteria bacterium]